MSASSFKTWEDAVSWLRMQQDQQTLVRDAYYDDPLRAAAERYWHSEEWQAIRAFLPTTGKALDIGAGRGIASYALAQEGLDVTALEPDPSTLVGAGAIRGLARDGGVAIRVVEEFSERLPFEDQSFDLLFARAVLHHTSDLWGACREFHRVLKPGGRLIAVREHVITRWEDLPVFLNLHPLHKLYGGENAFRLKKYQDAIVSAGFQLRVTLAPFDSPINFAPHTLASLQENIAARLGKLPVLQDIILSVLRIDWIWNLARPILNYLDNRPGRHYSFIADRL